MVEVRKADKDAVAAALLGTFSKVSFLASCVLASPDTDEKEGKDADYHDKSKPSPGGRNVDYDVFYPAQCIDYARHFYRILHQEGTVLIRCTWDQIPMWKKALEDTGLFVEHNPLLEHRSLGHQVCESSPSLMVIPP